MKTFRKVDIDYKIVFEVDKPWGQYLYGSEGRDKHEKKVYDNAKEMIESFKLSSNLESICQEAIEANDAGVVSSTSVDYNTYEVESSEVYLLEDSLVEDRSWRHQETKDDFIGALEWVLECDLPIRDPLYDRFKYKNKNGIECETCFYTFSELVEYFYINTISEFSCVNLNQEEEEYLKKIQHYQTMLKLSKNKI